MHLPWYLFLNFAVCETVLLLMFARAQWRSLCAGLADAGRRRARGPYHG
jgi:hypothetical protein